MLVLVLGAPPVLAQSDGAAASPPNEALEFDLRSLSNGAELLVVPSPGDPEVTVNLLFRGGTAADPTRLAGLASLTSQLLTHSTRNLTEQDLARAMDRLGARLGAAAGPDFTTVSLGTSPDLLNESLELMADVVLRPVLPADQLALRSAQVQRAIRLQEAALEFQATRGFIQAVYGDHPYGMIETPETLARIDVQDAVRYHRDYYRPNNAIFVVVGDVDTEDVVRQLESHFDPWESRPLSLPTFYGLPNREEPEILLVHVPGAPVAVVRIGKAVPVGSDTGWPAIQLASRILGADADARLARAVQPWAGDVRSTLVRRGDAGYYQVRFQARPDSVAPAVGGILTEIRGLGEQPPDPGEMELRVAELVSESRATRESAQQMANQMTQHILLGRGGEEVGSYSARLSDVTSLEVAEVAGRVLDPDQMVIVVAGDAAVLYEPLAALASVQVQDAGGRTVARDRLERPPPTLGLDASTLQPRSWTYRVEAQEFPIGKVTRRLVVGDEDGTLRLESDANVGNRVVRRQVTFRATPFVPVSSEDHLQVDDQVLSSSMAVEGGRVTGTLRLPRGEQPIESVAVPGALLGEMAEAALWLLDLGSFEEFTIPIIGQDGATSELRVRVRGERTTVVPAGTFETWEVELEGAGQNQRVFVTRDPPRQTVKIELVGQPVVTLLTQARAGSP